MNPPYQRVFFDCDSTLCAVEGIDELARRAGLYAALAPLTAAAMEGRMSLDAVYGARLERLRPDRAAIAWLGERYVQTLVPGAREAVAALHALGKPVHIVSGGILQAVQTVGAALAIAPGRVHAVALKFDAAGAYAGYDTAAALARSGGKRELCAQLLKAGERGVLIGDGSTDLEVLDAGIDMVGFGGVVARAAVRERAPVFVESPDLRAVLPHILGIEEQTTPLQ